MQSTIITITHNKINYLVIHQAWVVKLNSIKNSFVHKLSRILFGLTLLRKYAHVRSRYVQTKGFPCRTLRVSFTCIWFMRLNKHRPLLFKCTHTQQWVYMLFIYHDTLAFNQPNKSSSSSDSPNKSSSSASSFDLAPASNQWKLLVQEAGGRQQIMCVYFTKQAMRMQHVWSTSM